MFKIWTVSSVVLLTLSEISAQTVINVNDFTDTNAAAGGQYFNGTTTDLRGALNFINLSTIPGTYQIDLPSSQTIKLTAALPIINMNASNTITFVGSSTILDGSDTFRGLFIRQGTVAIENLTIQNTLAQAGNGSGGGGGGLGAGGALFIDQAAVTLSGVFFGTTSAIGGNGSSLGVNGGRAGGGMGGNAGTGLYGFGGGGGLGGNGGNGGPYSKGGGGGGGGAGTGAYGGNALTYASGGGGGAGVSQIGGNGGNYALSILPTGGVGSSYLTGTLSIGGGGGGGGDAPTTTSPNGQMGSRGGKLGTGDGAVVNASAAQAGGGGSGGGQSGGTGGAAISQTGGGGGHGSNNGGGGGGGGGGPDASLSSPSRSSGGDGGVGGGGGGSVAAGGIGGYGGGGGGGGIYGTGVRGTGGFGGGGGGGYAGYSSSSGGSSGGFGGGGGAPSLGTPKNGSPGGFGAGGGCGNGGSGGTGGVGGVTGGTSTSGSGGSGAGMGGAIFVNSGGRLTISGAVSTMFGQSTVTPGSSAARSGADIFVRSNTATNTITFSPPTGTTVVIANSIGDDSAASLPGGTYVAGTGRGAALLINGTGTGTVVLQGTNTYAGNTTVSSGILNINSNAALGNTSSLTIGNGTLQAGTALTSARAISLTGTASIDPQTNAMTLSGIITGIGSLTKLSGGTLTLAGTNSYSGGTTINAGALALTGNGTLLSSGSVALTGSATLDVSQINSAMTIGTLLGVSNTEINLGNKTLITNSAADSFFNGNISGASGLFELQGGGTLTLSGTNSYTNTIISETSTLNIGSASALCSGSYTINNATFQEGSSMTVPNAIVIEGQTSIDPQTFDVTLSGIISGSGELIKESSGTLFVLETNTYTGGTSVTEGTLNVENGSALGSGPCNLSDGTTLQAGTSVAISNPITLTDSATIDTLNNSLSLVGAINDGSSSGELSKYGFGILTLSGVNGYSGSTSIYEGTLNLTGSLSPTNSVSLFGTSTFETASTTIGDLSGDSGTRVQLNGALTMGDASSTTFAGTIEGTGSLIKQGTGTFYLSGTSNYTGSTNVNNGILSVNGAIISPVTVNSSGTLKGIGAIQSNVISTGTIRPGNSIGTLQITGNLTLNSGSTTIFEISPTQTSQLLVGGNVVINSNSTLQIIADGTFTSPINYTIVTFDGTRSGTFSTIVSPFTLFVEYNGNGIQLSSLQPVPPIPASLPIVAGGNSQSIIQYFNSLPAGSLGGVYTTLLGLTPTQLQQAMEAISPSRNAESSYIGQQAAYSLSNLLSSHSDNFRILRSLKNKSTEVAVLEKTEELLAERDDVSFDGLGLMSRELIQKKAPYHIWISGLANQSMQKAESQNPAFDSTAGSVLAALEKEILDRYLVGTGIAYVNASIHQHEGLGHSNVNIASAVLYGSAFWDRFYLELAMWNAYQRTDNVRHVYFPGFNKQAKSHQNGYQGDVHLNLGIDFEAFSRQQTEMTVEPFAMLDWACVKESHLNEKGAGVLDMHQKGRFSSMLRTEAGLNNYISHIFENQSALVVCLKLSYINEASFKVGRLQANLVGFPGSFIVNTLEGNQNFISPRIEFLWKNDRTFASLAYEGEFGVKSRSNEIYLKIGRCF